MKVDIHIVNGLDLKYIGYIESETFSAERFWNMCNWSQRRHGQKPENLFANIREAGRGICFTNPETNEMWLSKSLGWVNGNEETIKEYIKENVDYRVWL